MAAISTAVALASAAASAGASIYSANKQAGAAKSAAAGQQAAADRAAGMQQAQFETTRSDLAPYKDAGYSALDELTQQLRTQPEYAPFNFGAEPDYGKLDVSADAYKESPGLKIALDRGLKDIDSSLYAKGIGKSGAAAMKLADYATGTRMADYNDFRNYATDQFNNNRNFLRSNYVNDRGFAYQDYTDTTNRAVNQRTNLLTSLYQIAGLGQNAAAGTANAGSANANNQGNLLTTNADNQGQALVAGTNASATGLNSAVGALSSAATRFGSSYKPTTATTTPTLSSGYKLPTGAAATQSLGLTGYR